MCIWMPFWSGKKKGSLFPSGINQSAGKTTWKQTHFQKHGYHQEKFGQSQIITNTILVQALFCSPFSEPSMATIPRGMASLYLWFEVNVCALTCLERSGLLESTSYLTENKREISNFTSQFNFNICVHKVGIFWLLDPLWQW